MIIDDQGANLPNYAIKYAARYDSADQMLAAAEKFEHQSRNISLIGLGSIVVGTVMQLFERKCHDTSISKAGVKIMEAGGVALAGGMGELAYAYLLKDGARRISFAEEKGAVVIKTKSSNILEF